MGYMGGKSIGYVGSKSMGFVPAREWGRYGVNTREFNRVRTGYDNGVNLAARNGVINWVTAS